MADPDRLNALEVELRGRFMLQKDNSEESLEKIALMYSDATTRLRRSALICVLHAQFLLDRSQQPLLARRALIEAEKRSPAIDVTFTRFRIRRELEATAVSSDDVMSFLDTRSI